MTKDDMPLLLSLLFLLLALVILRLLGKNSHRNLYNIHLRGDNNDVTPTFKPSRAEEERWKKHYDWEAENGSH